MSAHVEYRCDMCGAAGTTRYERLGLGLTRPSGWCGWDGKHFCTYGCFIEHLSRLNNWQKVQPEGSVVT